MKRKKARKRERIKKNKKETNKEMKRKKARKRERIKKNKKRNK